MTLNIGMNYGHQSTYISSEVDTNFTYLKHLGFTHLRIAMPVFTDTQSIANVQQMIQKALAKGFYVAAGVDSGGNITSAKWTAHNQYVLNTFAPWSQSVGLSELILDNEVELHLTSEVTVVQARSDIRTLAANVKSGGFTGNVAYTTAGISSILIPWYPANEGLGQLDLIGINLYGIATPLNSNAFQSVAHSAVLNFGTTCYISEFGAITNGYSDYNEEVAWYNDVVARIADLGQELTNKLAYFFCFRDGGFGVPANSFAVVRSDGFVHLAMNAILGLPVTNNTVKLPNATRRG